MPHALALAHHDHHTTEIPKMLRTFTLTACLLCALGLAGCDREGPAEKAGERIDKSMERAGDKIERAGEKMEQAARNAGEKVEQAGEKMQEKAQ
jgi:hyperosmotically inducible protein